MTRWGEGGDVKPQKIHSKALNTHTDVERKSPHQRFCYNSHALTAMHLLNTHLPNPQGLFRQRILPCGKIHHLFAAEIFADLTLYMDADSERKLH